MAKHFSLERAIYELESLKVRISDLTNAELDALDQALHELCLKSYMIDFMEATREESQNGSCEDVISVPTNVIKYRANGMVAYNVEWLKKHWQMEMNLVCGIEFCDNAISRQTAMDEWNKLSIMARTEFDQVLMMLPSVNPQKVGKWIRHKDWEDDGECGYECSECGMGSDVDYAYCMRCGAKMVEKVSEW